MTSEYRVTPVGNDFEGTWFAEVEQAAAEWSAVGCPIAVGDDGVPVSLVPSADWRWNAEQFWGYYTGDEIVLRNSIAPNNRHKILLHEMGHMLGYEHSDHGIMRPHVAVDFVTADDCH